jgi:hypothetical protein
MQILRRLSIALSFLLLSSVAHAQAPLLPDAFPQYLSSTGAPLAGGSLTFDAAGTTTPQTVYSDSTLTTPLANPYTLDAAGRPPLGIYLSAVAYKIILKDSTGTTIRTQDNVYGATYLASLAVAPSVQTTTSTGTVNDFATASITSNLVVVRCNNAADLTLTGFTAATTAGQQLLILSVGAGDVFLPHQNTGSAAANREINFATSGSTPLAAGSGLAKYVYDTTTSRWRLILHEQGAWITPTFAAGSYTGVSSQTWTLDPGDVVTQAYYLRGRTLTVSWNLLTTTVGGTPALGLQIGNAAWGSFTIAKSLTLPCHLYEDAGGANTVGFCIATAADTKIQIFKISGNWSAATNTSATFGQIALEVQ